ncbi:hypothetical protein DFH11DRAFT_1630402 [Phellopilus nigrolimitatus]|nr:hypothetical protein DFH11DRAFT_1630402 [Phellopilus nigrolimitatus]
MSGGRAWGSAESMMGWGMFVVWGAEYACMLCAEDGYECECGCCWWTMGGTGTGDLGGNGEMEVSGDAWVDTGRRR